MRRGIKFETFVEARGWFGREPEINLLEKGGFGFSTSFNKKYKLTELKHVVLHFAEDEGYYFIGFTFSNDANMPGSHKISHPKKEYGLIQCISFFKKYKTDYHKYKGKYKAEVESSKESGNMYVISVRK